MFGQVVDAGGGGVICLAHAAGFVRFGWLGVSDLGWRQGAARVWSVGGGALAEGREGSGGGREGAGAGFGDVEDVEVTTGAGFDLGAG